MTAVTPAAAESRRTPHLGAGGTAGPNAADAATATGKAIDLAAAYKLIGGHDERQRWLREMLQPGGMAPGDNARAHARAYRFVEALEKAGYRISETPSGPRGGRRFTLLSYAGPRAGAIRRLQQDRGCSFEHPRDACDCFDGLTDGQLKRVAAMHRRLGKLWGLRYQTDTIASLVRNHDEQTLDLALNLYCNSDTLSRTAARLEDFIASVEAAHL